MVYFVCHTYCTKGGNTILCVCQQMWLIDGFHAIQWVVSRRDNKIIKAWNPPIIKGQAKHATIRPMNKVQFSPGKSIVPLTASGDIHTESLLHSVLQLYFSKKCQLIETRIVPTVCNGILNQWWYKNGKCMHEKDVKDYYYYCRSKNVHKMNLSIKTSLKVKGTE